MPATDRGRDRRQSAISTLASPLRLRASCAGLTRFGAASCSWPCRLSSRSDLRHHQIFIASSRCCLIVLRQTNHQELRNGDGIVRIMPQCFPVSRLSSSGSSMRAARTILPESFMPTYHESFPPSPWICSHFSFAKAIAFRTAIFITIFVNWSTSRVNAAIHPYRSASAGSRHSCAPIFD